VASHKCDHAEQKRATKEQLSRSNRQGHCAYRETEQNSVAFPQVRRPGVTHCVPAIIFRRLANLPNGRARCSVVGSRRHYYSQPASGARPHNTLRPGPM